MYSKEKADWAVGFIKQLKHTKGKWHGVPFSLLDWQEDIIREVFGTVRDDGYRQYKYVYVEVPKKNGKSELGAPISLYMMMADNEMSAEVYGCAADKAQASLVFDVAVDMVDQNPILRKNVKLIASRKRMVYTKTNSFYQVLSAEAFTKHGLNPSAVIFDELHAQPNRELWDVMTFGSGDARAQPLFFVITTAGDDPDRTSIGWEIHKKAEYILLGNKVDPSWIARIYGIDPGEKRIWTGKSYYLVDEYDWKHPDIWKDVNPSCGHTIQVNTIEETFQSVFGNEAEERKFRWLRLNEWVKYRSSKWISQDIWDKSSTSIIVPEKLYGDPCYGGLDLSSKTDITAFVLLFQPTEMRKKWVVIPTFWIPEDSLKERVLRDKVPYDKWLSHGFIKTTPGNVIDYDYIENEIIKLRSQYGIQEIGFDPWNAMQTAIHLEEAGLTMVEVRQGYKSMSPAMKELEKLLIGREIEHGGNPVLRWMFGNLEVKGDENDNIRPIKSRATERIDGIVALINAIARGMLQQNTDSVYENRGIISF